jgi:hypothetical protein
MVKGGGDPSDGFGKTNVLTRTKIKCKQRPLFSEYRACMTCSAGGAGKKGRDAGQSRLPGFIEIL